MSKVYQLPAQIVFPNGLPSDQRLRLQAVIVASLRTVIQARANNDLPVDPMTSTAPSVREYFAAEQAQSARRTAAVTSAAA